MKILRAFASPPSLVANHNRAPRFQTNQESRSLAPPVKKSWKSAAQAFLGLATASAGLVNGSTAHATEQLIQTDSVDLECRMVVLDNFKTGEKSHGHKVGLAGESVGDDLDIVDVQLDTGKLRLARIKERSSDSMAMSDISKNAADVSEALDRLIISKFTTQLDILSEDLGNVAEAGYTQSTANVSQGNDEAGVVMDFYRSATLARRAEKDNVRDLGVRKAQNFAKIFDLDHTKFLSEDPTVAGPELQKLQQAIIDRVHEVASTNEEIASSRARWAGVVSDFESDNNSVVVAAGNSGRKGKALVAANGGRELELPATFFNNSLAVDSVTNVGAITPVKLKGQEQPIEIVATYNSPSQGIDIYANGNVSFPGGSAQGTSFAAPKMAAAMTDVHCENPDFTSEEVEAHIADHRTRDLTPYGKGLTVLDLSNH